MTPPTLRTHLFGNPLSLAAAWLGFAYACYRCGIGDINPVPAALAFVFGCFCLSCFHQIRRYRQWQREWNGMNGAPEPQRARPLLARVPGLRPVLGFVIWGAIANYLTQHSDDPAMAIPALFFWAGTLLLLLIGAYRLVRRMGRGGKRGSGRVVPVTVCVARVTPSPSVNQAFAALPAYCATLLATGAPESAAAVHGRR